MDIVMRKERGIPPWAKATGLPAAFSVISRLHEITVPTMIICGSEDRLTPPKYSNFLLERLTGIEHGASLHIFPNAGHYVMREQAEMVNRAIDEWV